MAYHGYDGCNKKKLKEKLTEARALKAKALRRINKFTELYDDMFSEKLKTHKISRQQLSKFHVRRANDFVNPDKKFISDYKSFVEMADFRGSGQVTAKEFDLFLMCYGASAGFLVPTNSGFEAAPR